jgi:hypothetical protein
MVPPLQKTFEIGEGFKPEEKNACRNYFLLLFCPFLCQVFCRMMEFGIHPFALPPRRSLNLKARQGKDGISLQCARRFCYDGHGEEGKIKGSEKARRIELWNGGVSGWRENAIGSVFYRWPFFSFPWPAGL